MKIVRFILILAVTAVMASCSQENSGKTEVLDVKNDAVKAPEKTAELERPFSNPVLMHGSSFGNYFQALYKVGRFEEMLKFTSSESIKRFGKDKILEFYKNMDFAYNIVLKSKTVNDSVATLNYEAGIMATRHMLRIDVVLENDTCKILLKDLKSLR
jgi:hypothetical protein